MSARVAPQTTLFFSDVPHKRGARMASKPFSNFSGDPFKWYYKHFDELLQQTRDKSGFKIRIVCPHLGRLNQALPAYLVLADHVVISPPPIWLCQYSGLNFHPWPGFVEGLRGLSMPRENGNRFVMMHSKAGSDDFTFPDWLLTVRPFLEEGMLSYLPRCDDGSEERNFRWNHRAIHLPDLLEKDLDTPEGVRRTALEDLLCEHVVSEQLGCIHIDPTTAKTPLLIPRLDGWRNHSDELGSRALVRLRIPFVGRLPLDQLLSLLHEEASSVRAFRRSIRKALKELEGTNPDSVRLSSLVTELQGDLIDAPFATLTQRIRHAQKLRTRKNAVYAGAAVAGMALCWVGQPDVGKAVFAGVSIPKIMEMYYGDVERDIGLKEDALYWLYRAAAASNKH